MRELRVRLPAVEFYCPCCLDRFSIELLFFTYWLVSFYYCCPITALRAVALNVFLYLRIMPLSAGNIWVMVFIVVGTEVWYACLTHSLSTVLHTERA